METEDGVVEEELDSQPNIGTTKIVLNGQEVEVPDIPDVVDKIKQMEHNLKSGYDKKLQAERDQLKGFLDYDTNWYSTHDTSEWGRYVPKLAAGEQGGYVDSSVTPEPTPKGTKMENAFDPDVQTKVNKLEAEIALLKEQRQREIELAKAAVNRTLTASKDEFKYADVDTVIAGLEAHFLKTGNHATPEEVRDIMRASHNHVAKFVTKQTTTPATGVVAQPKSATPTASATPPTTTPGEKKTVPIDDVDALMADWNNYRSGGS